MIRFASIASEMALGFSHWGWQLQIFDKMNDQPTYIILKIIQSESEV